MLEEEDTGIHDLACTRHSGSPGDRIRHGQEDEGDRKYVQNQRRVYIRDATLHQEER